MALREMQFNPWQVRELIVELKQRYGFDEDSPAYWVRRHFKGHPPGFGAVFAPVAANPPLARVFSLILFGLCVWAAYWVGVQFYGDRSIGVLFAVMFACIPEILWWHAHSVNTDIPPCLPCYLAIGILGAEVHRTQMSHSVETPRLVVVGALLAIGCIITLTAFLAALACSVFLLRQRATRDWRSLAIVLLPSVAAVALGQCYSAAVLYGVEPPFLATGITSNMGYRLRRIASLFRGTPQDLGPPLCVLIAGCFVWALFRARAAGVRQRSWEIGAALAVILPGLWFPSSIRYMYTGLPFIVIGLGMVCAWQHLGERLRSWMLATIISFAVCKYVMLTFTELPAAGA